MFSSTITSLVLPILSLVISVTSLPSAFPAPGACSGACQVHDPSVIQRVSDGTYFHFSTGGGIGLAKSSSLTGSWTAAGSVLSKSKITVSGNSGTDLWAPDVSYIDGTYYLYYSVSTFGSQNSAIGLATSPSLDAGTWTDHGAIGVSSKTGSSYNAIDPNLLRTTDGKLLMNFGSFWDDIYQVSMASPTGAASGAAPYQLEYNSTGTRPSEGSFVFNYSGYYYLLWSSGVCCNYDKSKPAPGNEYKIMMCRSTSATGGYVDRNGTPCTKNGGSELLGSSGTMYGPGGQGVFSDKSRGLVLYYHYANTNVGLADSQYLLGWNTLKWSGGWPSVV